jgi:hypothetical protein
MEYVAELPCPNGTPSDLSSVWDIARNQEYTPRSGGGVTVRMNALEHDVDLEDDDGAKEVKPSVCLAQAGHSPPRASDRNGSRHPPGPLRSMASE